MENVVVQEGITKELIGLPSGCFVQKCWLVWGKVRY